MLKNLIIKSFLCLLNNYIFTKMSNKFLSQNSQSDQQTPIVLYLNDKLKFLEVENNELKKEINSKSSKFDD